MWNWDYDLPRNWRPKTHAQWEWFLVRKINYGDFGGLTKEVIKKYFPKIRKLLDPGKKALLQNYLSK